MLRSVGLAALGAWGLVTLTVLAAVAAPAVEVQVTAPAPGQTVAPEDEAVNIYRAIIRASSARSPSDSLGNGIYESSKRAFYAGDFDAATARAQEFVNAYSRNLNMNDAMEMVLLIKESRDFQDQPLKGYAGVLSLREAGRPDSAAALAQATLTRWPGASVRYHLHYQLAELAAERGDHAASVAQALAVADSSSKSRLAPAALKLAGDELIGLGQGPDRALKLYQELLQRYPTSPLAPAVRTRVLEMRKKLQL